MKKKEICRYEGGWRRTAQIDGDGEREGADSAVVDDRTRNELFVLILQVLLLFAPVIFLVFFLPAFLFTSSPKSMWPR